MNEPSSATKFSERNVVTTSPFSDHHHEGSLPPGLRNFGRPRSRSCIPHRLIGAKDQPEETDCHAQAPVFPLDLAASVQALAETCRIVYTEHRATVPAILASIIESNVANEDKGSLTEKSLKRGNLQPRNNQEGDKDLSITKDVSRCPFDSLAGKFNPTNPNAEPGQPELVEAPLPLIGSLTDSKNDSISKASEKSNVDTLSTNAKPEGSEARAPLSSKQEAATEVSFQANLSDSNNCKPGAKLYTGVLENIWTLSAVERVQTWQSDQAYHHEAPCLRRADSAPVPGTYLRPGHRQVADTDSRNYSSQGQEYGSNVTHRSQRAGLSRSQRANGSSTAPNRGHIYGRRPPSGPSRQIRSPDLDQQHRYPCVCYWSDEQEGNPDCAKRKQYVSQLRRHHETHGFFYCINCFQSFEDAALRDFHIREGCSSKCVTETCSNNRGALSSCSHGRNSQDAIWRALYWLRRSSEPASNTSPENQARGGGNNVQQPLPEFAPLWSDHATAGGPDNERELTSGYEEDEQAVPSPLGHSDLLAEMKSNLHSMLKLCHDLEALFHSLDHRARQDMQWLRDDISLAWKRLNRVSEDIKSTSNNVDQARANRSMTNATTQVGQFERPSPLRRAIVTAPRNVLGTMLGSFHNIDENFGVMDMTDHSQNTNYSGQSGQPSTFSSHLQQQIPSAAEDSGTAQESDLLQYGNSTINPDEDAPYDDPVPDASNWNGGFGNWP